MRKLVVLDYKNAVGDKVAAITYTNGKLDDGQDYDFYSYIVFYDGPDGVLTDDVYTWDSPANIGDDTRIVNIMKGFGACVGASMLTGSLAGLASGGNPVVAFATYSLGVYGCMFTAHQAWVAGP